MAWKGLKRSFKNKILLSTLVVLAGGVLFLAATLELLIFPRLKGDPSTIFDLKILHLVASLAVIGLSWIFIEFIHKIITRPLLELTEHADQISREVGKGISAATSGHASGGNAGAQHEEAPPSGDEISQLKTSFYRMLSHLKAYQERLKESEEKHRFLFHHMPYPVFVLDADDMNILDVNARAETEYQYSRDEFLGKSFWDLAAAEERKSIDAHITTLMHTEAPTPPVFRHKRRDGTLFLIHIQARLIGFKGKPALIVAVWDVTEKLEKDAKLYQTAKMATLGEMATGIAHELNQPLNVIKVAADYLKKCIERDRTPSHEELRKASDELGMNVDRAARIIAHLREFGRKAEETMRPISISQPIRSVFALMGAQLSKQGIKWNIELDDTLPDILGDKNRLEQVFVNLILNARDAMLEVGAKAPDSGRHPEKALSIRSFAEDDRVVVTVSDTGPGVPPYLTEKVFEPFFTTKRVGEGTGIGLSISYGIVKEHRGTIEVNGSDQKGATFKLTFPSLNPARELTHDENTSG